MGDAMDTAHLGFCSQLLILNCGSVFVNRGMSGYASQFPVECLRMKISVRFYSHVPERFGLHV